MNTLSPRLVVSVVNQTYLHEEPGSPYAQSLLIADVEPHRHFFLFRDPQTGLLDVDETRRRPETSYVLGRGGKRGTYETLRLPTETRPLFPNVTAAIQRLIDAKQQVKEAQESLTLAVNTDMNPDPTAPLTFQEIQDIETHPDWRPFVFEKK